MSGDRATVTAAGALVRLKFILLLSVVLFYVCWGVYTWL